MADVTKYIREYLAIYRPDDNYISLLVHSSYEEQKTFSHIPTREELEVLFEAVGFDIDISDAFEDCVNMAASPKLPDEILDDSSFSGLTEVFRNCPALIIPPKLPDARYLYRVFYGDTALKQAPVIPTSGVFLTRCFYNCSSLVAPASLPPAVRYITSLYEGCTAMAGEMIVRATPSSSFMGDVFKDTTGEIILYGDKSVCEAIAATANNGNASWQPWYDPQPAVTDRGQGSYTTAADMTRMVRNGALAVNTYAPGRIVYRPGDIVREDEWNALVEAAQTIDPTVTYSTVYTNLNKIEAAFEAAL